MMLPETNSTLVIEDGDEETREYTLAGFRPSVFDRVDELNPFFRPLGNEQGSWRIHIGWLHGECTDPRPAVIRVNTCAEEEHDHDVIGDHETIMYVRADRSAFYLAYALSRALVAGKLLDPVFPVEQPGNITVGGVVAITIVPSRHHVAEAAA